MRRILVLVAVLMLPALGMVATPAAADPATAVQGIRAYQITGTDPFITELRYPVSANDPDQDAGSFTYDIMVEGGSGWVNVGPGSLSDASGGFRTVLFELGGSVTQPFEFNITADSGTGGATDSACTVTINLESAGDWATCGSMAVPFEQIHCLPRDGDDHGFNYAQRVTTQETELRFKTGFGSGGSNVAAGGLNLAGDTAALRIDFSLRAASEGASSETRIFWSEVPLDASSTSYGNGISTGSFSDGWTLLLEESGSDWDYALVQRSDGNAITHDEGTFSAGVDANVLTDGFFTIDTHQRLIHFGLGLTVVAFNYGLVTDDIEPLQTLWITERRPLFTSTFVSREGDSLCVSTLPEAQGGGVGAIGGGETGGGLEDFSGEGGFGGDPMFPGVDLDEHALALGMTPATIALVGGTLMGLSLTGLGYALAREVGAGLGAALSLVLAFVFNLAPAWILVVVFMAVAGALVLLGRARS